MRGIVMDLKTLLLIISISINIYLVLNLDLTNDNDIFISESTHTECERNIEDTPVNIHVASGEEIGEINTLKYENSELVQKIASLEIERENCIEELKSANLKLEFSSMIKAEEENSIGNTVYIDEDMPEEIQQIIASYAVHLTNEETDETWDMNVRNTLDVIVEGEAFQGVSIVIPMECRTTLCKYEIEALDTYQADLVEAELSTLADQLGGEVALYKHKYDDSLGSVRVIMYYAKEGHSLPTIN
jgi:hypothetical protein